MGCCFFFNSAYNYTKPLYLEQWTAIFAQVEWRSPLATKFHQDLCKESKRMVGQCEESTASTSSFSQTKTFRGFLACFWLGEGWSLFLVKASNGVWVRNPTSHDHRCHVNSLGISHIPGTFLVNLTATGQAGRGQPFFTSPVKCH